MESLSASKFWNKGNDISFRSVAKDFGGASPLQKKLFPHPLTNGKGIKGMGLIKTLIKLVIYLIISEIEI